MARIWAGIHYRSDHFAGLRLGRAVARLVIAPLGADGGPHHHDPPHAPPPTRTELHFVT